MPARPRRSAHLVLLAVLMAVAGCAIQPDGAPRDIPENEQPNVDALPATGGAATGSSLIFLVDDAAEPRLLRSVMRDVRPERPGSRPGISAVLGTLFRGPNATESTDDLSSAIPPDLELIRKPRSEGRTWVIDVNEALDQLDAADLRIALAQIVTTATALESVDEVKIRVNGEKRKWPKGDGSLTEQDEALTSYDFPGIVESTQPPYPSLSSTTR